MNIIQEKENTKYGFWTVLEFDRVDEHHDARWLCRCELCGEIHSVRGFTLRNGKSTHCRFCNRKAWKHAR